MVYRKLTYPKSPFGGALRRASALAPVLPRTVNKTAPAREPAEAAGKNELHAWCWKLWLPTALFVSLLHMAQILKL